MYRFFSSLIHHSLWTHYLTLAIVLGGVIAVFNLRREARPPVNFDRLAISVAYRGASAEDVEQLVIRPIEEKLEEVDGIEEYRSTSFEGIGILTVKLDPDYSEKDEVVDEVRRVIDQIRNFPAEVEDPVVTEIKAVTVPVITVALFGSVPDIELRQAADLLKDRLRTLPGVSRVDAEGMRDLQYKIETTPRRLANARTSIEQVMEAIRRWNIDSPGGAIDDGKKDISIRIQGQFRDTESISNLPIRANDAGKVLRIKDIATVKLDLQDADIRYYYNGVPAISLTVVKKEDFDTISTVNRVKSALKRWRPALPNGLQVATYRDDSRNIRTKLGIVRNNALIGLGLVMIALMLTLSFRMALVTAVGLPIAFLGGLFVLWWWGFTINTLVVLGIIVVLGMLVDDAIIVAENIYFHVENGVNPKQAALKGVYEVWGPVTATVLTTMMAFLPLVFMKEIIGKFIRVMPIVVIFMLLFSLIESLLILPSHAADFIKKRERVRKKQALFDRFRLRYEGFVDWTLQHKVILFSSVVIYLLGTGLVVYLGWVKFVLFPASGIQSLNVRIEAAPNTSRKITEQVAMELAKTLKPMLGKDILSLNTSVGESIVGGAFGVRERGPHLSKTTIRFTEDPEFVEREKQVIALIRKEVKALEQRYGVRTNIAVARVGPPIGRPIAVEVRGRDYAQTQSVARNIEQKLSSIKGVKDVQSDLQSLSTEYRLAINRPRAAELGLNLRTIASTVFSAFDGIAASTTRRGNDEVDIVVTFPKALRETRNSLLSIPILNQAGQYVPLSTVAKIREEKGRNAIQRLNGQRTITVFGDVDNVSVTSKQANQTIKTYAKKLSEKFPDVSIVLGGEEKDRIRSVRDTAKMFALALIGIFIIISLVFESLIFPFFVILAIPFGISGAVWALVLHGSPMTMMGMIGVVGLSGVVVNGAIILVQFILAEVKKGKELRAAIVTGAGRRLRPVLLTTFTTMAGLFPAIYGIGGVDTLVQPLALTLGWGLFFSTVFILLTLPALIMMLNGVIHMSSVRGEVGDREV